jgi:hypothetical protein
MTRENIKFKAKSIYNGEWVYGDLLHKTDGTHIYIFYTIMGFVLGFLAGKYINKE